MLGQRWFFYGASAMLVLMVLGYHSHGGIGEFSVNNRCDLRAAPCKAVAANGEIIELAILPLGIPQLKPLEITVNLMGFSADSVAVVFTGVDVDMGTIQYPLVSVDGLSFSGGASLSVCSKQKMRWRVTVVIESNGEVYAIPFEFDTVYRPEFHILEGT
ncbi:hypothetical protein BOW53_10610 [Solemya pervernicosa gill symbiont]|uniref:YtkA-like domain-containing protein n=2 Tax=Gammaproteobacteria incertae sedis TaxID=118884 RepID=A0A1T2L3G0_9GAMM|nr:hypothetical protein BOW53_10610 [Solemya pervernicosa gill symbiont]